MTGNVAPMQRAPQECSVGCCSQAFPAQPRNPRKLLQFQASPANHRIQMSLPCFRVKRKLVEFFPLSSLARNARESIQPQGRCPGWLRHIKATHWDGGTLVLLYTCFYSRGPLHCPPTQIYTGNGSGVLCVPPTIHRYMHTEGIMGSYVHPPQLIPAITGTLGTHRRKCIWGDILFFNVCLPEVMHYFAPKNELKDVWPTTCGQVGAQSWEMY